MTHRLDKAEYAVKKVYAKFSKERVLVKILREVTLLAKVRPDTVLYSVADPDPGSGAFLTPGSGIRNGFFFGSRISDPGSIFGKQFFW